MSGAEAHVAQRMYAQGLTAGRMLEVPGVKLEQRADDTGTYLPWFDLMFTGGARVRVTFEGVEQ